ncbi:MAG: 2-oxo acid dehydrogenase subunit E2 [Desulfobacteraceae bacterium]|nr:MAG: 2-oxo acid dehydrogenase subunit E2 [Desulfobacteraceae bacterium]
MAKQLVIPKLGMTMKDAKVVEWKAGEGEWVEKGKTVLIIETAKVTYEVEAPESGFIHIVVPPGETRAVGEPTAWLAESQEELTKLQAEIPGAGIAAVPAAVHEVTGTPEKVRISMAAKRLALDHKIDFTRLTGTGPGGRIVREDVEAAIAEKEAALPAPASAAPVAGWTGQVVDGKRVKRSIPLQGMRANVAEHMIRSLQVSAQLTVAAEVDMTEMIRLRNSLVEQEPFLGVRISYTDLMVFVLARALKQVPIMNSSVLGGEIKLWEDIHIGVAVAIKMGNDSGLIVPVVRNADQKELIQLSREIKGLSERARRLQPLPDDLGGGTFTISNVGSFGKGWSITTPIINQPEAAILGTGAIVERAVVREGQIVVRPIMTVSLTFDHRILDGAPVGEFLMHFSEMIEDPHRMFNRKSEA